MIIGICEIQIFIYESRSLKEKRSVVKSIIERIKTRYNVSIIESDKQDIWNESIIAFSVLSVDKSSLDSYIQNIIKFIENDYRIEITNIEIESF